MTEGKWGLQHGLYSWQVDPASPIMWKLNLMNIRSKEYNELLVYVIFPSLIDLLISSCNNPNVQKASMNKTPANHSHYLILLNSFSGFTSLDLISFTKIRTI
jgi:hypothetical protein